MHNLIFNVHVIWINSGNLYTVLISNMHTIKALDLLYK
jgi:hypothetical protein